MAYLYEFTLACALMGVAIGLDVAIVTALYSNQLNDNRIRRRWLYGVTATHTVFPMIGYMLSYFGLKWLPGLSPILGLVAFSFIAYFLYQELSDYHQQADGTTHSQTSSISLALIIAVSWDALWSGPAKSAQIINWPESLVWLSFIVVGVLVLGAAHIGLAFGRYLQRSQKAQKVNVSWHWLQYTAIAYFGLLALFRYTFDSQLSDMSVLLLAAVLVGSYLYKPKQLV